MTQTRVIEKASLTTFLKFKGIKDLKDFKSQLQAHHAGERLTSSNCLNIFVLCEICGSNGRI